MDTDLVATTTGSDPYLVVLRETFHAYLDLTDEGYGIYTNVQSIYLLSHVEDGGGW